MGNDVEHTGIGLNNLRLCDETKSVFLGSIGNRDLRVASNRRAARVERLRAESAFAPKHITRHIQKQTTTAEFPRTRTATRASC